MRIYLDTDLWNVSCDQGIDPVSLLEELDKRGCTPVFGIHVLYEILKNFTSANEDRGRKLFGHVGDYFRSGLRCIAKDVFEALVAEMYGLKGAAGAEKFLPFEDVQKISDEVERLEAGSVKDEWFEHIAEQKTAAANDREQIKRGLASRPTHRDFFRGVSQEHLSIWLGESLETQVAIGLLTGHLQRLFPAESMLELSEYSTKLLQTNARTATAIVKADLYYAWRCANRGSNRADLLDDMYHVLSAAYCDVYASGESKQAEYASQLLHKDVRVCTYDRSQPLSSWLKVIAGR
jgi:hypothetical protein